MAFVRSDAALLVGVAAWVAAGGAFVLGAATASAHGRFPQAGQVVVDPNDEARIWVRTTYGLITTDDGGGRWRWICPEGVGFDGDKEDPPVGFMNDGSLLAGTFDGLSITKDGCDFVFPPLMEGRFVIDLAVEPSFTSAIALSSNGVAADTFEVRLYDTSDNGDSWTEIGTAPPSDFLALTLGVAPSDPQRVYLTGRDGTAGAYAGVLQRSDDRGESWTRLDVPGTAGGVALPYMGQVDPDDADRVYLGVVEQQMGEVVNFTLLVSEDGGASFTSIFERQEAMSGFSLSPDGSTIAVGGAEAGLWLASSDDYMFSKVNEIHVRCLTWVDSGLYACADQFIDGYNLARSDDGGQTFTPLSELSSPCGPPSECGEGTSVGNECPSRWPEEKLELNAEDCDAGSGGAGAGGGGAGADDGGGCSCRAVGYPSAPSPWLAALSLLGLVWRCRRR